MADIISAIQQNLANRQLLLKTAIPQNKEVGTYNSSLGQNLRIAILNLGIITRFRLFVYADVVGTKPESGNLVFSLNEKFPWSLFKKIKFVDYDQTDRINISGYMLSKLNEIRYAMREGVLLDRLYNFPKYPVGGTYTSNYTSELAFNIDIPLAYDPEGDLRGAIIGQTANKNAFIELELTDNIGDLFTVSNGTVELQNIKIKVIQEYYYVIPVNGKWVLPDLDLNVMYELVEFHTSDNISAGNEKYINYPHPRSVIGAYVLFENNGAMSLDEIEKFRIVIDSTNTIKEWFWDYYYVSTRHKLLFDLPQGLIWLDHRNQPIETSRYGNVQLAVKFKDSATFNNPDFTVLFENFHPKAVNIGALYTG